MRAPIIPKMTAQAMAERVMSWQHVTSPAEGANKMLLIAKVAADSGREKAARFYLQVTHCILAQGQSRGIRRWSIQNPE